MKKESWNILLFLFGIIIIIFISISVYLYYNFPESPFHYFGLLGFFLIGWFVSEGLNKYKLLDSNIQQVKGGKKKK